LGRFRWHLPIGHWREILRAIRSHTYADSNGNEQSNSNSHLNGNSDGYAKWNTASDFYSNRNAKCHTACYSLSKTALDTKATTYSASSHNTCAASAVTTAHCVAATDSAAAHHTLAAPIFTPSHATTAPLIIALSADN